MDQSATSGVSLRPSQIQMAADDMFPTMGLSLVAWTPLQLVQATNYLRYGPQGVRRFGPSAPAKVPRHPLSIEMTLTLKSELGHILLKTEAIRLSTPKLDTDGVNIWRGEYEKGILLVTWVWDFYRLMSKIHLLAPKFPLSMPHEALRNLSLGGKIIAEASSKSGDILQIYPLDQTAQESKI